MLVGQLVRHLLDPFVLPEDFLPHFIQRRLDKLLSRQLPVYISPDLALLTASRHPPARLRSHPPQTPSA